MSQTKTITWVNLEDLVAAVTLLEKELPPDVAWELVKITNPHHGGHPFGGGVGLSLMFPHTKAFSGYERVWEKSGQGRTLLSAAETALMRYKAMTSPVKV